MFHEESFSGITFDEYDRYRISFSLEGTTYGTSGTPYLYLKIDPDGGGNKTTMLTIQNSNGSTTIRNCKYEYVFYKEDNSFYYFTSKGYNDIKRVNLTSAGSVSLSRKLLKINSTLSIKIEGSNYAT